MALQQEQEEERSTEVTEEEGEEVLTTVDIKDFLKQWENVHRVIEIHHPNKVNAGHSVNLCEENAVRHFSNVLNMFQKTSVNITIFSEDGKVPF